MADVVTIEEQMRESMRGPRIYGVFLPAIGSKLTGIPSNTPFIQPTGIPSDIPAIQPSQISQMPSIESWEFIPSSPEDPFSLSLGDFLNLELDVVEEMLRRVSDLCKGLLEKAWGRGLQQVVICDGEIVLESRDVEGISNEAVERLAKERKKPCYVFSAPDVVEDSIWTPINNNDFYPTLPVYVGTENSDEAEILETNPIYADLDTGNPSYKIFSANELIEPLTSFTSLEMGIAEHLKRDYIYFRKTAKICVKDVSGNVNSIVCIIRVIRDWEGCALLQASPNRKGFIGRDILRALGIRLKLDPLEKTTRILDVSS